MVTKIHFRIIFLCFILLSWNGYSENIMKSLNLQEAHDSYIDNKIIIVDVRTKKEWKETGIIPNSILLNMHNDNYEENKNFVNDLTAYLSKNPNENIAFICASGSRSEIVVNYFTEKGYNNLSHIPDGIVGKNNDGWLFLGFPLKSPEID